MNGDFSNLSFDISNQTVLVAGAGGGIGSVVSQMLATHGARLILLDRDANRLDDLKSRVQGEQHFLHLDICDCAAMQELFKTLAKKDCLPNSVVNAVGMLPIRSALSLPAEEFRACLEINVTGAFILSQTAADHMKKSEGGAIVHLSSVSATVANVNYVSYATSKAALDQMVRVLAREWAPLNIRVNAIGPALIETPLTADYLRSAEFRSQAIEAIPMGRLATVEDLLGSILLLLSPAGRFITGQTIFIDGGRTLT
jgi:NAD(P)-dependent dehydrogenase (short-subunit alcohol dehydrogenase family)